MRTTQSFRSKMLTLPSTPEAIAAEPATTVEPSVTVEQPIVEPVVVQEPIEPIVLPEAAQVKLRPVITRPFTAAKGAYWTGGYLFTFDPDADEGESALTVTKSGSKPADSTNMTTIVFGTGDVVIVVSNVMPTAAEAPEPEPEPQPVIADIPALTDPTTVAGVKDDELT